MKRRMWKLFLAALLLTALVLGGRLLFRTFVTDRVTDKDGMENPFVTETAEESAATDDQETKN